MTKNRIALLVGGWSAERQVSLDKGKKVEAALLEAGYEVEVIDVRKDAAALVAALSPPPYCVFNNLHGTGGEDGVVQGVLEMLGVPYTHSGVTASAVAMDKPLCKRVAAQAGVRVPEGRVVPADEAHSALPAPYVVKPPHEGSSVGVHIVREGDNRPCLAEIGWPFGESVLVEPYIPGRELTVAVLDGRPQAVTEIRSAAQFFDYEAKYHAQDTVYVMPADIPQAVCALALESARRVYEALGCRGLARCDFRWDDSAGEDGLYFLEINTQPGLTAESIGPSQAIYNGYTFPGLCAHLVESAVCHANEKQTPQKEASAAPSSPGSSATAA